MKFQYILDKIQAAKMASKPFSHLQIDHFLSQPHLKMIQEDRQVHFLEMSTDEKVVAELLSSGYRVQSFPGCTNDPNDYLARLKSNVWPHEHLGNPIGSYGITFRLQEYKSDNIRELIEFLSGLEFHNTLRDKFNIQEKTEILTAIQKNLSKYEICPHPDIRTKALTYLLNINKDARSEKIDIHTHLLKFKKKYEYIYNIWETRTDIERCWVPWNWCKTIDIVNKNNTIVIFAPSNDTLHAVKLDYDHRDFQRTQIYGNLNYSERERLPFQEGKYQALKKDLLVR